MFIALASPLGTGKGTKMDEFSKKLQRGGGGGGVIFNPRIYIADFGPLNRALKRVLGKKYLHYDFLKTMRKWVKGRSEFFRKFNSVLVPPPVPYAGKRSSSFDFFALQQISRSTCPEDNY